MIKNVCILLLLVYGCNTSNSKVDKDNLEAAKTYYQILDQSRVAEISSLISDSLVIKEVGYDYEQVFSEQDYINWLKWDSIFNPTYTLLEIEQVDSVVKTKVSKSDTRILFLHKKPTVYSQILHFREGEIALIENKNIVFNDSVWVEN